MHTQISIEYPYTHSPLQSDIKHNHWQIESREGYSVEMGSSKSDEEINCVTSWRFLLSLLRCECVSEYLSLSTYLYWMSDRLWEERERENLWRGNPFDGWEDDWESRRHRFRCNFFPFIVIDWNFFVSMKYQSYRLTSVWSFLSPFLIGQMYLVSASFSILSIRWL